MAIDNVIRPILFHIEERRAWLRASTHTIVFDHDPSFSRFSRDQTGHMGKLLRIWIDDSAGGNRNLKAYLGAVSFCDSRFTIFELIRVFRRASEYAENFGESGSVFRHQLADAMRKNLLYS